MNTTIFNRISFLSLFLVIVLLPIFFLPFTNTSVEISKGFFLVLGLVVSLVFWIMARFSDGQVNLPKSWVMLSGGGVVLVTLLSALFSSTRNVSLFGTMFDVGSFWFILGAFILMLMSAIIFREPKNARLVLIGTILSGTIVLIFQSFHLFLPKILSLGVLVNKTDNIVGSWNALGIFMGFYIISSLFVIEFFPLTKRLKLILGGLVILSSIFIAIVNFTFIWEIVGIFALLIFIYKVSINSKEKPEINEDKIKSSSGTIEKSKAQFPVFSFVIVLVALLFFTSSQFIGGILPSRLGISNNEVSPSFMSTMSLTKSVIRTHPLLGTGPNRFADAWALYKPTVINSTAFWDVSFNSGSGLIPTLTATTGILGILAWVVFFGLFIVTGVRWLFTSIKNNVSLETVSFFFLSLYLFVSSFFYFTGTVIFLLAFVFAGISIGLIASSRQEKGNTGEITLSFFNDHRKSFFFMLFLVLLTIISVIIGFNYIQRFASISYFGKTLSTTSVPDAERAISRALSLNSNDLYFRTYSQVYLAKLSGIVGKGASSISEAEKAELQTSLDQAVNGAQAAINYNRENYLNPQMLGSVYQTAGLIGVKDAYASALLAYQRASELNPGNPRLRLALASVSIAAEDKKSAKEYANQALLLKPDYADALIVLSQIAKSEGDNQEALSYAQRALSIFPTNEELIDYVNTLQTGSSSRTTTTTTPEGQ